MDIETEIIPRLMKLRKELCRGYGPCGQGQSCSILQKRYEQDKLLTEAIWHLSQYIFLKGN